MVVKLEIKVHDQRSQSQTKISYFMAKDYGHEVRFSPEHHILLKYGENLLKYSESVKKIGNGKSNLLGTLFFMKGAN